MKPEKPKPIRGWINLDNPCGFYPIDKFPKAPNGYSLVDLRPVSKRKAGKKSCQG